MAEPPTPPRSSDKGWRSLEINLAPSSSEQRPRQAMLTCLHDASRPLDLTILGLNSGSNTDGIDCTVCRFRQETASTPLRFELLKHGEVGHDPPAIQTRLDRHDANRMQSQSNPGKDVGSALADAVRNFCSEHDVPLHSLDAIGSHTQPAMARSSPASQIRSQAQGWALALGTGVTSITDFGVIKGGNLETPGIDFLDAFVLRHPNRVRACIDVGRSRCRATLVGPSSGKQTDLGSQSFEVDVGPGTILVDEVVWQTTCAAEVNDDSGQLAAKGTPNPILARWFMDHHASALAPLADAHTDSHHQSVALAAHEAAVRGRALGIPDHDIVSTVADLLYRTIPVCLGKQTGRIDEIFLAGRSANNAHLAHLIASSLNAKVLPLDAAGLPARARDAVAAAWLGMDALIGRSTPSLSRSDENPDDLQRDDLDVAVWGRIAPGKNYRTVMRKAMAFGGPKEQLPAVTEVVHLVAGRAGDNKW